jgi:hypothetical protein
VVSAGACLLAALATALAGAAVTRLAPEGRPPG